jgi:hypothetical protein
MQRTATLRARLGEPPMISFFLAASCLLLISVPCLAAPPGFLENVGQFDSQVLYVAESAGTTIFLTQEAIVLVLHETPQMDSPPDPLAWPVDGLSGEEGPVGAWALWIRFAGANPEARVEARDKLPGYANFFFGSDPAAWRTHVASYEEILYRELWPGIDLVLRITPDGLVWESLAQPGAPPDQVRFDYEGAAVQRLGDGSVRLETGLGTIFHQWASRATGVFSRRPGPQEAPPRDDPGALVWSTFLGGSSWDYGVDLETDPAGNAIVTGWTDFSDFPATPGAYDETWNGGRDIYVAKLSAAGDSLLWSTFVGGSADDYGFNVLLEASGAVLVAGATLSSDFPTTPGALDPSPNGDVDLCYIGLTAGGDSLLFATYIGGSGEDHVLTLVADGAGGVVMAGSTDSADFPTTPGAFQENFGGVVDGYVLKASSWGDSLIWCTYLGSDSLDIVGWGSVASDGTIVVPGASESPNFPTTPGAYDETFNGLRDAIVARLSADGTTLLWSTFVGGDTLDVGRSAVVDALGNVVFCGATFSADFPTTPGAFDETSNASFDGFVAKLSASGGQLLWSTYYGGTDDDVVKDCQLTSSGFVVLTGWTLSADLPVTPNGYDTSFNGSYDAYVAQLSPYGDALVWGSFVGGTSGDVYEVVKLDPAGDFLLVGEAMSPDFPVTPGAYDETYDAYYDAVVSKIRIQLASSVGGTPGDRGGSILLLYGNAPNPFRQSTVLRFRTGSWGGADVVIYDVTGREVRRLHAPGMEPGLHAIRWEARDHRGRSVPSGVYFYRLSAGQEIRSGRLVLAH